MDINVRGLKGGVGTTTVALAIAIRLAERDGVAVAFQPADWFAAKSILAMKEDQDELKLKNGGSIVFDAEGQFAPIAAHAVWESYAFASDSALTVWVGRNDYLSAKSLTRKVAEADEPAQLLLIAEKDRVLRERDFADLCGDWGILETPHDPAVARAYDAGVLQYKMPRMFANAIDVLIGRLKSSQAKAEKSAS